MLGLQDYVQSSVVLVVDVGLSLPSPAYAVTDAAWPEQPLEAVDATCFGCARWLSVTETILLVLVGALIIEQQLDALAPALLAPVILGHENERSPAKGVGLFRVGALFEQQPEAVGMGIFGSQHQRSGAIAHSAASGLLPA